MFDIGDLLAKHADKLILASTALGAVNNILQGNQASDFYSYQAAQANADAQAQREQGQVNATKIRRAGKYAQGEARAAYGASGVNVNSGTALDVQGDIQGRIENDALVQLLTGRRAGAALDQQAAGLRMQADNSESSGLLGAVGSLLSGAAAYAKSDTAGRKWSRSGSGPGRVGPYIK